MSGLRLAYFGLPLGALLLARDGHELTFAAVSPIADLGIRRLGRELHDRVLDPRVLRVDFDKRVDEALALGADLVVSWFFTRKIPERWCARARLGGIGVHPSLLPKYRGPNPFFWAIDSGDRETGATAHRLGPEYDDGPILATRGGVSIGELDSWRLARRLDRVTLVLLREVVRAAADGAPLTGVAQDERAATWAPEPTNDLLRVDWSWPTERVLRRIRALSPVPGLALRIRGRDFFVTRAEPAARLIGGLEPGEAALDESRTLCVATGDAGIRIARAVPAEALSTASPAQELPAAEDSVEPLELSAISDWLGL